MVEGRIEPGTKRVGVRLEFRNLGWGFGTGTSLFLGPKNKEEPVLGPQLVARLT